MEKVMAENVMENIGENLEKLKIKIYDILGIDITEAATLWPEIGAIFEGISMIANASNTKKLHDALRALSKNENIEKSLNELYGYVSNEERALYVSTAFRKIILSNSKIAAAIIGLMLGEIKLENREFNNDDAILFNALETMTDFDIRNFKSIMEGDFIATDNTGRQYFDVSLFPDDKREDYLLTLTFGERNRILSSFHQTLKDGKIQFSTFYQTNKFSDILLKYINKVNQIINYGI